MAFYDINGNVGVESLRDINGDLAVNFAYDIDGTPYPIDGGGDLPTPVDNYTDVLFAQGDIYVRLVGSKLYRSMDGGKTFPVSIDVSNIGIIKNIHVFTDGTLNVFGHTKAYYSDDWELLRESTVLDINGDPFVPSTYDNFTISRHNEHIITVGGVEMYVFGNYCISDEYHTNKNVWYTIDKGHTYKSAYFFGLTNVRHIHNVYFYPADNSFWITTGDSDAESKVIKGYYDSANDIWSWTTLGTGFYYKWAGMAIYNDDVYYALDHTPGSVRKCSIIDVPTVANHIAILSNTPNDCINVIIDSETGEMVVGLSIYGGNESTARLLYYSANRRTFDTVNLDPPEYYPYSDTMYYGMCGITNQKKILSGLWSRTHENLDAWDKVPSIWIDDIIRSKWPNAFQQTTN